MSDKEKASCEQIYTSGIDEIRRESEILARKITEELKKGNDASVRELIRVFHLSSDNRKSGLFPLISAVLEKTSGSENAALSQQLQEISDISESIQVSFAGLSGSAAVEKFGLLAAEFHLETVREFLKTSDSITFAARESLFSKIFRIYSVLHEKMTRKADTASSVFNEAIRAYYDKKYDEAISLFRRVISMDSIYASENGCYYYIGRCYEGKTDYSSAVSSFKQSIIADAAQPYKLNSYTSGFYIFASLMPQEKATYIAGLEYIADVRKIGSGEVLENADYDEAAFFLKLARCKELSTEERVSNFITAAERRISFAEKYPASGKAEWALRSAAEIFDGYNYGSESVHFVLQGNAEERERLYLCAVDTYQKLKTSFPADSELADLQIAFSYMYIGKMEQTSGSYYIVIQRKPEFSIKAAESFKAFHDIYPASSTAAHSLYMAGASYADAAEAYMEKGMLPELTEYFLEALKLLDQFSSVSPTYSSFNLTGKCYKNLAICHYNIGNSPETTELYVRKTLSAYEQFFSWTNAGDYGKASSLFYSGDVLRLTGKYQQAVTYYDRSINSFGNIQFYGSLVTAYCNFYKSECLYHLGLFQEGIQAAQEAIAQDVATVFGQDLQDMFFFIANCYMGKNLYGLGEYQKGVEVLEKALNIYPQLPPTTDKTVLSDIITFRGLCRQGTGDYSGAAADFTRVVKEFCNENWPFNPFVIQAQKGLSNLLSLSISPMTDSLEPGQKAHFTATAVYPDGTPAPVSDAAFKEWIWECSGNEGDGHSFEFSGNTAVYTSGSGDFMDTLITAKAKLDAGISLNTKHSKLNTRSVDPHIWISGENQVPISLVNEDGERIRQVPVFSNDWGKHYGKSSLSKSVPGFTINFKSLYQQSSSCEIEVIYCSENRLSAIALDMLGSGATKTFEFNNDSEDGSDYWKLQIESPEPLADNKVQRFTDTMVFYFTGDGLISKKFEIPVTQVQKNSSKSEKQEFYKASNQSFSRISCGDVNPDELIPLNAKFRIQIRDHNIQPPPVISKEKNFVTARISSKATGQFIDVECNEASSGIYRSDCMFAVPLSHTSEIITVKNENFRVIRVNPADGFNLIYPISKKSEERNIATPGDAFAGVYFDSNMFNMDDEGEIIRSDITALNYQTVYSRTPSAEMILKHINDCSIFYLNTHGAYKEVDWGRDLYTGFWVAPGESEKDSRVFDPSEEFPELEKGPDFMFINGCYCGKNDNQLIDRPLKHQNVIIQKMLDKVKPAAYLSWETEVNPQDVIPFSRILFNKALMLNDDGSKKTIAKSIDDAIKGTTSVFTLNKIIFFSGDPSAKINRN